MRIEVTVSDALNTTRRTVNDVYDLETLLTLFLKVAHDSDFGYVESVAAETESGNIFWSKNEHDDWDY